MTHGAVAASLSFYPWGEERYANGTLNTTFRYTGQRQEEQLGGSDGLYYYNSRWFDPVLGRFASPDTIVPEPYNPQDWDRYAYVRNNPVRYSDPTGHWVDDGCQTESCSTNQEGPPKPDWSSTQYLTNKPLGNTLARVSTFAQYSATVCSTAGASMEVGFALAGSLGGSAALGWIDGFVPIADIGTGLGGLVIGAEAGHAFHMLTTDRLESGFSTISTFSSVASDMALGNTRIDGYKDQATITLGEATATSAFLTFVGNFNTIGIADAVIDSIGSAYSAGKIPSVYGFIGIKGKSVQIAGPYHYPTYLQFGNP